MTLPKQSTGLRPGFGRRRKPFSPGIRRVQTAGGRVRTPPTVRVLSAVCGNPCLGVGQGLEVQQGVGQGLARCNWQPPDSLLQLGRNGSEHPAELAKDDILCRLLAALLESLLDSFFLP